jgi:cardiolipin synthase
MVAGSTRFEILMGAQAFWRRAAADIAAAGRRVLVQAMTFEGDAAGLGVAEAIAASPAARRAVLVDDYSRWIVSDRHIWSPSTLFDRAARDEVRSTRAMFADLVAGGVGVRVTNPVGFLFVNFAARNHKKLIVADHVAYLGGINFSDHNFTWPDFMLRLEGEEAADLLAGDFEATYAGAPSAWRHRMDGLELHSLDGRTNAAGFADVFAMIESARREIVVISPYLTFPFSGALARAAGRGVTVRLITPWASNKPAVRNALLATAARAGFEVHLLPGMTHLKGLLIDDERLIVGSSNFDFASLAAEEELLAVISDRSAIEDFRRRIVAPLLDQALPPGDAHAPTAGGLPSALMLNVAAALARPARHAPRGARDWAA